MIKIMLDAASDSANIIPYEYYIPLNVEINGKHYKDSVDLKPQRFYKLLANCAEFPKTSQPSPEDYIPAFEQAKENGDEIIYLCVSSALSGTYQSANIAKQMVEYDHIHIVDTKAVTHLIGMLAAYAHRLHNEGHDAQTIIQKVKQLREKQVLYAGLQTLEYLHRGGRLSSTSAAVGSIANIKPILTLDADGKVTTAGKAIGVKRAIHTIVKNMDTEKINTNFPVWSVCTVDTENCEALENALYQAGIQVSGRMQVGPTIGAHVGPGVYGVIYVEK